MENHKKILGILYIVTAVFQALMMLVLASLVALIMGLLEDEMRGLDPLLANFIRTIVEFLPVIVLVFMILPGLIAGIALVSKKPWAPLLAMIVGIFKLFSFPIGTAIGIYAIWIYFEDKKVIPVPPPQV